MCLKLPEIPGEREIALVDVEGRSLGTGGDPSWRSDTDMNNVFVDAWGIFFKGCNQFYLRNEKKLYLVLFLSACK